MANEWELKKQICEIGRRIYQQGYVAANDGNITVRIGPDRFLCTPTMVSKGFMEPEDIAVVDRQANQLSGRKPRTSEILLHLEVFEAIPEVNAVVHAHPPHATAFAVAGVPVPSCILPEVEIFIGQVPIAEYDTPGSKNFAETILPHLRNKANTILLSNHGVVTFGNTLEEAYFHVETLDLYCKILLLARQVGGVRQLPDPKMNELLALKKKLGFEDPRIGETDHCTICGSDEFLRGYSTCAIPGHTPAANGSGHGEGIANLPSQSGQPQPVAAAKPAEPAPAAAFKGLGSSSSTAQQRASQDEQERLVQMITDRIVEMLTPKG